MQSIWGRKPLIAITSNRLFFTETILNLGPNEIGKLHIILVLHNRCRACRRSNHLKANTMHGDFTIAQIQRCCADLFISPFENVLQLSIQTYRNGLVAAPNYNSQIRASLWNL